MANKTQEELYNLWIHKCAQLNSIRSFIQNDFDWMLEDGKTTREEIQSQIVYFEETYDSLVFELDQLKKEIVELMKEKGATNAE